jgi:hypothetical protein
MRKVYPDQSEEELKVSVQQMLKIQEYDRLAVLQQEPCASGEGNGRLNAMRLQPNFEIAMYLAQATGASIITDSPARWQEMQLAIRRPDRIFEPALTALSRSMSETLFCFPQDIAEIFAIGSDESFAAYHLLLRDSFKYLAKLKEREPKPNVEQSLAGRFARAHEKAQATLQKVGLEAKQARIRSLFPKGGIQDNTINRLLLMSSSEHHLPNVPMAFFIEPPRVEPRTISAVQLQKDKAGRAADPIAMLVRRTLNV